MDFALVWQPQEGYADLVVDEDADDLQGDPGLRTAIELSLFTDRRAEDDDDLPGDDGDRRGWLGDELLSKTGDRIGSRLWLLDRSKSRPELARDAEAYAREALAWLIEDRITDRIDMVVEVTPRELFLAVDFIRPNGDPASFKFAHVWEGEASLV